MLELAECEMLLFLGGASVCDLMHREIPAWYLAVGTFNVCLMQVLKRREEWYLVLFGLLTGMLFLLLAKMTEQKIGYGDSWMILILGIFSGIWKLSMILGIAFASAAILAGIGIVGGKLNRKSKLPFCPFLFIGLVGSLIW